MEWETEMETNFDELLEIICPPVQNNEVYDFILDVTSYQQLSPSPVPQKSDGITKPVGELDIIKESTAKTARRCEKRRGRPRKPVLPLEMKRRQKAANGRERKRMSELTRLFNELKHCLPVCQTIKSKKEILVQAIKYINELRYNNAYC